MYKKAKAIPLPKDERVSLFLDMLSSGRINRFGDIFLYIPKTSIAGFMSIKGDRFNKFYFEDPGGFKFAQFFRLGKNLNVDPWLLIKLFEAEVRYNATHKG